MIVNAVVDVWNWLGVSLIVKYEDNLALFRSPAVPSDSSSDQPPSYPYDKATALSLISYLNVPWHPNKGSTSFGSSFVFIGLQWDLVDKTVSLPPNKHLKYVACICSFLDRFSSSRCQLKDVKKLHGTLCYASFVYLDGRTHLPSLSNFAASFTGNIYSCRYPSHALKTDLRWWLIRLSDLNFRCSIHPPGPILPLDIFVDASTSWGIGIVVDGRWMAFHLMSGWKIPGRDIGWLETVAVELIAYILDRWNVHEVRVVIHSDNQGTIGAMDKGQSPNYHINMSIRRTFSILMPRYILPSFVYIESAVNPADPISRGILGPDEFCIPLCLQLPEVLSSIFEQC
jgi:hypothetical protein